MQLLQLFKKDTIKEVQGWVKDGIITNEQGDAILARYNISAKNDKKNALSYYILTALGALFIGLAIILLISHNWDEIPRLPRMLGLIIITLCVNLQGIRLFLKDRQEAGCLWLFFGGLCYGAAIILIAQIYHLGEHFPDGIFYWALGIWPLVFLCRSRLIGLECLFLATLWMLTEAYTDFFPASYPLFVLASLWLALTQKHSKFLFLSSIVGLWCWLNLLQAWHKGEWYHYQFFIQQIPYNLGIGLICFGVAQRLMRSTNRLTEYGTILHLWSIRANILLLFILSFDSSWLELAKLFTHTNATISGILMLSTLISILLAKKSNHNAWIAILITGVFYSISLWLLPEAIFNAMIFSGITNLMLVLTGIWLICQGIDDAKSQYFYTGVSTLLLTALLRYIDLIGDYIGGSVLFLISALILLGAARYRHQKKH